MKYLIILIFLVGCNGFFSSKFKIGDCVRGSNGYGLKIVYVGNFSYCGYDLTNRWYTCLRIKIVDKIYKKSLCEEE